MVLNTSSCTQNVMPVKCQIKSDKSSKPEMEGLSDSRMLTSQKTNKVIKDNQIRKTERKRNPREDQKHHFMFNYDPVFSIYLLLLSIIHSYSLWKNCERAKRINCKTSKSVE